MRKGAAPATRQGWSLLCYASYPACSFPQMVIIQLPRWRYIYPQPSLSSCIRAAWYHDVSCFDKVLALSRAQICIFRYGLHFTEARVFRDARGGSNEAGALHMTPQACQIAPCLPRHEHGSDGSKGTHEIPMQLVWPSADGRSNIRRRDRRLSLQPMVLVVPGLADPPPTKSHTAPETRGSDSTAAQGSSGVLHLTNTLPHMIVGMLPRRGRPSPEGDFFQCHMYKHEDSWPAWMSWV